MGVGDRDIGRADQAADVTIAPDIAEGVGVGDLGVTRRIALIVGDAHQAASVLVHARIAVRMNVGIRRGLIYRRIVVKTADQTAGRKSGRRDGLPLQAWIRQEPRFRKTGCGTCNMIRPAQADQSANPVLARDIAGRRNRGNVAANALPQQPANVGAAGNNARRQSIL